jgi:tRNA U34 5-carboxymethylaminomethyl modifying enzyme MnmG/GidA
MGDWDVIVVGGGHAGVEAAHEVVEATSEEVDSVTGRQFQMKFCRVFM